jgi:hypothetical protein
MSVLQTLTDTCYEISVDNAGWGAVAGWAAGS